MNNLKKYVLFSIAILLVLIGCETNNIEENKNDNFYIRKEYYPDSTLKVEGGVIYDTLWHGEYKCFFPTGILKKKSNFYMGSEKGINLNYHENGKLESIIEIKNDKKNGFSSFYHENGNIKSVCNCIKNDVYGRCYFYREDGKLYLINFFDYLNETFYVIEMNEKGDTIYNEGVVFSPNFEFNTPKESIKVNEKIKINIAVAELDNKKTFIKAGVDGKLKDVPIKDCIATYETVFNQKGEYKINVLGEIYDENNKLYKSKNEVITIVVK